MRGNLHDVIRTSRHLSYFFWSRFSFLQLRLWPMTPPPPSPPAGSSPHHPPSSVFAPHSILRPLLCVLLCSVAPSHLSSLHLPATNHNLFTSPRAHSTTLLAPIADLFIPDNAEGWRLWFETRFAECISHGLTAWAQHSLGLIDVTLSRAELLRAASVKWSFFFFFKTMQRDDKKKRRYSAQRFTANLAAGRDERQQVAHLLMGGKQPRPASWLVSEGGFGEHQAYITFSLGCSELASVQARTPWDDKSFYWSSDFAKMAAWPLEKQD